MRYSHAIPGTCSRRNAGTRLAILQGIHPLNGRQNMKKFFVIFFFAFLLAGAGYGVAQYVNSQSVTAQACNAGCE